MLEAIDPDAVMFLINAIHFKGDWRGAFDRGATRSEPFTPRTGASSAVPMMHRVGQARVRDVDGGMIADLGYGGDAFSMTVVLPTLMEQKVDLSLPRFALSWEKELNEELKEMGMPTAFVGGSGHDGRDRPDLGALDTRSARRPALRFLLRERISGTVLFIGRITRLWARPPTISRRCPAAAAWRSENRDRRHGS